MKKLFLIGVGGNISSANIEVHDMQLHIAEDYKDITDKIISNWYGDSIHLDSVTEIKEINGYIVNLESEDFDKNIYLVVYGGYIPSSIDELHDYSFIVADSKEEAKIIAKKQMKLFKNMDHIDNIVDVFKIVKQRFSLIEGDYLFKNNHTEHMYVKLK